MIVSKKPVATRFVITFSPREAEILHELAMSVGYSNGDEEGFKFARALCGKLEAAGVTMPEPFLFKGSVIPQ